VVRSAKLRLALIAVLVVLGHLLALEWLARQADAMAGMTLMVPPMYTRLLKPTAPPPVIATAVSAPPAQPKVRAAPKPKPPASSPEELERARKEKEQREAKPAEPEPEPELAKELPPPLPEPAPEPVVAQEPAPAASEPVAAASAPAETASAPAAAASSAAPPTAALDNWPTDTRLSYRVSGEYRGPLYGNAKVQWQREGEKYQVRLEVNVAIITQILTSQGEVTPQGLIPRSYEEMRTGGRRRVAQLGDRVVVLEKGEAVPRPPGVQDTASQFVELAQRFATGKEVLQVGHTVSVWLARPGGVDQWTYEVVERVMLQTPKLGAVEAFHLKPRGITNPRGNITAEMWFAPSLQYLPVKIKVIMGNEAYLDLIVEQIEQR
jgi:outer membrane biosynthesis protein TonB